MQYRDLSSKGNQRHRASRLQFCRECVDGDQHRRSLRILYRLQNFEADRFQSNTDNANVIKRIGEGPDAGLLILVAD